MRDDTEKNGLLFDIVHEFANKFCSECIEDEQDFQCDNYHIFGKAFCGSVFKDSGFYRYSAFEDEIDKGTFLGFYAGEDDNDNVKWYGMNPKETIGDN